MHALEGLHVLISQELCVLLQVYGIPVGGGIVAYVSRSVANVGGGIRNGSYQSFVRAVVAARALMVGVVL